MKVLLMVRDKRKGGKSIEGVFHPLAQTVHPHIQLQAWEFDSAKSIWANIRSLLNTNANVFHITGDIYYLTCLLPGRKVIITIHDIGRYKELQGVRKWVYGLWWLKWPVKMASRIVAVSNFTQNDIAQLIPNYAERIMVIPNGIHPDFKPVPKIFNTARPRILQVGTAVHKNLETVFTSLQGLDCVLSIVGQLTDEHIRQLKALHITHENYVDLDIPALRDQYEKCDMLVFVSLHEGFGLPVVEAQTVGRPVITSRMASIPEVAGDAALFIEHPMDADELRAAINRMITETPLRNALIEAGYKNAQRYTYDNMANSYLKLYQEVDAE